MSESMALREASLIEFGPVRGGRIFEEALTSPKVRGRSGTLGLNTLGQGVSSFLPNGSAIPWALTASPVTGLPALGVVHSSHAALSVSVELAGPTPLLSNMLF